MRTRDRPAAAIAVPIQLSLILVVTVHRDPESVPVPTHQCRPYKVRCQNLGKESERKLT